MNSLYKKLVLFALAFAVIFSAALLYCRSLCYASGEDALLISDAEAKTEIDDTNFPDMAFREYIKKFDTDNDGFLSASEIKAVTVINVADKGVTDLTGIEFFTNLWNLTCSGNNLSFIDLSGNTELWNLDCRNNTNLSQINFGSITGIASLNCSNCDLSQLDLKNFSELLWLYCYNNKLTAIDVSKNSKLNILECHYNELTDLNLSDNSALTDLNCCGNHLTTVDVSVNGELTRLICGENELENLDTSHNTKLKRIDCDHCKLTRIDVSNNIELTILNLDDNLLKTLDLSSNTKLQQLYCNKNQLTSIDLSDTNLTTVTCVNNKYIVSSCNDFDLSELSQYGFDITKAGNWRNSDLTEEGKLVFLPGSWLPEVAMYTYDCGNGITAEFWIEFPAHKTDLITAKEPTCTEAGNIGYYHCTVCGHNFSNENCSKLAEDIEISETGHEWGAWVITTEPSETEKGAAKRVCANNAGHTETKEVPELTDTDVWRFEEEVPATEDEDGYKKYVSKEFGTVTVKIPATGHKSEGTVTYGVELGENVPETELAMPLDEVKAAVLTDNEKNDVQNGIDIKIMLAVEDITEKVSAADKTAVEAALSGLDNYRLGQYLDISLLKIIGDVSEKITDTNGMLTVTFGIPETLRGKDRDYAVIRVHGEKTTVLHDLDSDDNTVTIQTDKFSTYALAFSEKDKDTNDDPQTGDHAPAAWLIALCASALTVCVTLLKKRGTSREI